MTPYICLIAFIFLLPIFLKIIFKKNINNGYLLLSMIAIFLIMALKSTSVGTDTYGYSKMYESFFHASWSNYDLYWTEWGYETLEMIFTHFFHFLCIFIRYDLKLYIAFGTFSSIYAFLFEIYVYFFTCFSVAYVVY